MDAQDIEATVEYFRQIVTGDAESQWDLTNMPPPDGKSIGQFFKVLKSLPKFTCLHPKGCDQAPIKSHSIQKNPSLTLLARHNHLIKFKLEPNTQTGFPKSLAKKIGVNDASIFRGFCPKHDTSLFKPIELQTLIKPTEAQLRLLAFRALAHHYVQQYIEIYQSIRIDNLAKKDIDRSPESMNALISGTMHSIQNFSFTKKAIRKLGKEIHKRTQTHFTYHRVIKRKIAFATSAVMTPMNDFAGNPIYGSTIPACVMISVIPMRDASLIAVTIPKKHLKLTAGLFKQIRKFTDVELVKNLFDLVVAGSENVFLSPQYWDTFSQSQMDNALAYYKSTHYLQKISPPEMPLPFLD